MTDTVNAYHKKTLGLLYKNKFRYESHLFDSGAAMIDIWVEDEFYVLQFENDIAGISLIDDKGPDIFSTRPDTIYRNMPDYWIHLCKILKKTVEFIDSILANENPSMDDLMNCFEEVKDAGHLAFIKLDPLRLEHDYTVMITFTGNVSPMIRSDSADLKEALIGVLKEYISR